MSISFGNIYSQKGQKDVHFYGHVNTDRDSVQLKAFFAKNFVFGQGYAENIFLDIPVDNNGNFHFELPPIDHIGRINFYDKYSSSTLFSCQIVEPGDSVGMTVTIHDSSEPYYMKAEVWGKGSSKYECTQALKRINNKYRISAAKDVNDCLKVSDSILNENLLVLDKFRPELSTTAFGILKADIIGDIYNYTLLAEPICGDKFDGVLSKTISKKELLKKRKAFGDFIAKISISNIQIPDELVSLSSSYVNFLYIKAECELVFSRRGERFEFNELYKKLRGDFKGMLREKLLTYCFAYPDMHNFFEYCDADDYTACLHDASSLIKTPWLKQYMTDLLKARGKGEPAFEFIFPADSTFNEISLSSLKGRVLLLDMWGYSCTACHLFANALHEKVYPLFKGDSNFAIVSIMPTGSRAAYMRRLRGEGGVKYTFPEYINLFGGDSGSLGEQMERHYNINAWPFILLVDKKGQIYSSTIPFFIDANSPNVEKLIDLIKKALADI